MRVIEDEKVNPFMAVEVTIWRGNTEVEVLREIRVSFSENMGKLNARVGRIREISGFLSNVVYETLMLENEERLGELCVAHVFFSASVVVRGAN